MGLDMDVTTILAFTTAFAVFLYVVMDGFDLGIALLFPLVDDPGDHDIMVNTIAPVWDGNETWLVLGGGAVLAGFPLAYAVLMPALYVPVIAMLLGLVFRGVAFEFRFRSIRRRHWWDRGFVLGSLVAALAQGVALGAILQGVAVEGRAYAGGWWDWLTPFTVLTGISVCLGYALLGASWLILKTEGRLRDRAYALARPLALATLAAIAAVSLATPFLQGDYWRRWFTWPTLAIAAPVPLLTALVALALLRSLAARRDHWPFVLTLALFALCFVGLGVSMFPWIVPGALTIHDAAAPETSQKFFLVGVILLIPVILVYTAYSYWVFRGKVGADAGYH
ncbi:cytochrome d ubiquinol oxidase subunit II [Paracoccus endophyticus]|uniref:cytochrome d ubiquinol oxidase subunit II n=1 Tax=Paracoccus endophyticus TaxID=2233774 RepID=UPI000DD6286B